MLTLTSCERADDREVRRFAASLAAHIELTNMNYQFNIIGNQTVPDFHRQAMVIALREFANG